MKKFGKSLLILLSSAMLIGFAGCKPEIKYVEKEVEKIVEVEKTVFVCPKCQKSYDTAQKAADCCGVQIEYVDKEVEKIVKKYVCPRDGEEYDTAEEAKECCGPVVEEKLVYTTAVKAGTYTVYHFQQKTSGGKAFADYILYATENSKAVAENSTLENLKKTYAGFTAKTLAQNENVLYVFYDRNVITYTYLSGSEGKFSDGTTEKVIKGLYGAPVSAPSVTSATHYFGGWFTSDNAAPGSTYGEEDLILTVKWTPKATSVFNWYETPVDAESGEVATAASTYVYFGVFPKTVLPESSGVTVDETEIKIMGANTYYMGNDGNWYEKVTENRDGSSGYIYSDGTTVKHKSAASTRYFKVEPIKWKVLTTDYNGTGRALLLAEDILTANVPYYDVSLSERTIGGNTVYANNYKYSTIRAYLNGAYESDDEQTKTYEGKGFLQTAFTSSARLLIAETEVDNRAETTGYNESTYATKYACENTTDKIFLLSESEVINSDYGFDSNPYVSIATRNRVPTDYAKANHAYQNDGSGGTWRLRSPYYDDSYYALGVCDRGGHSHSTVNVTSDGVVPALSISF